MTQRKPYSTQVMQFLGSMNLAITLLVVIALASIIGTVLQQNQPYPSYVIKFGAFWFDIFRILGLYDIYSSVWFLTILAFLVISTATCIVRNTPGIVRELKHFREHIQEKSLRLMKHSTALHLTQSSGEVQKTAETILKNQGYRFKLQQNEDNIVIAAKKGSSHYWGYWLTHIGMIVICLGGLLDSRLPIMLAEWQGTIKPETRPVPVSEIAKESFLSPNNLSFRGNVNIAEGQKTDVIFLPIRDSYLVQPLPFKVELKDFRVEHYSTGMPKSFESDLVIYDSDLAQPISKTISVNHPLIHKGIAIYQADFGDGGSEVDLKFNPFNPNYKVPDLKGNVFKDYKITGTSAQYKLELTDFRLFNILPITDDKGIVHQRNVGPSVTFKVRNAAGEAIEYLNYMSPIMIDNRNYIVSGIRTKPGEALKYLHIPIDEKGTVQGFMQFLHNLQNPELVRRAASSTTQQSMQEVNLKNADIEQQVIESMIRLTQVFATRGFEGISADINQRFPEPQRAAVNEAFAKVLNVALRAVYLETLKNKGITNPTEKDWLFYDDSLSAMANLPLYGSPWYVQLTGFKQIQASGLQMTRSPGQNVVYLGCLMLVLGVFLMFYVAQRRIWIWLKPQETPNTVEMILAGTTNRQVSEFEKFMKTLRQAFESMSVRS
ncbi:cytochrome c biogenesis protein ResB [Thiofilum flexile]|uniref:cytochrome c biogenesis protein ResB n=1 Tax=Thiofilum flexile TaxID=125627 RepID=UPI000377BC09|nr:cytochrome c biogenesis protein ResB [Thiofilum flexile]